MISTTKRIISYAIGGATCGITQAIYDGSLDISAILLSLCIGIVVGAIAGGVASISVSKFIQGVLTGVATGLSVGVLSFYVLGSGKNFWIHTFGQIFSFGIAGLVFRYMIARFGPSAFFALTSEEKTQSNRGQT